MTSRLLPITLTVAFGIAGSAALVPHAQISAAEPVSAAAEFELQPGDTVCYIGNTLADRMQHHSWLETYIHSLFPKHELTFRNLGFSADEVNRRQRSDNFGSPDQWLTQVHADVVFCFFGYNEALRGEAGLAEFKKALAGMIDGMLAQKYNGDSAPRLVIFSPIAHENLNDPNLPDGSENNAKLAVYTEAMRAVSAEKNVPFVDLFTPTKTLYAKALKPLTVNGIHLLDHGNKALAGVITKALFGAAKPTQAEEAIAKLREAVLEKNYHWFSRYRVVDGYNVFGGRSRLAWHGQSNADVMRREMEIFDVMTANRDKRVWARAQGRELRVVDSNIPKTLTVKTNKPGKLPEEKHPYLGGKEAISKMKIGKGLEVNLFASEEMFPEVVNPVQMAVDSDGRLFASVWPSYPHWNPTQPRADRIVCLPDEDGDGVADRCVIYADKLNSVTGFEFWGGGMLVAALPEIWHLKDTDGDDKADYKVRMLQGVSSADTHHSANALVIGPDGWLYWSRGIFNTCSMETPTKTFRSGASGVYRFNPRTFEIEFHFPIGPNPHGDVFDQWGYQFANDGTGGTGSYVNIGKGKGYKKWFKKRVRPVAATGILSSEHFPEENNDNFLICNTITVLGVLQHEVRYDGADITAHEIEPIVVSSDPNFRPTDVEIGGDGALYVSDWCNVLIGHMQHNMRDPNRDDKHGRIYRVTAKGRDLLKPHKLKGKPVDEVCETFFSKTNAFRYRARLELSGRESKAVTAAVGRWAEKLDAAKPDQAQALLECLWVFEEHRIPNLPLLKKVLGADEARVRAAAIRTLGHWSGRVEGWETVLLDAARDPAALVRAEAAKAAVELQGLAAAEAVFEIATRPTDAELDYVINYARGELNVDKIVDDAVASGRKLSPAMERYVLSKASVTDLLKLERSEAVYSAILARDNVPAAALRETLDGLAKLRKVPRLELLLATVDDHVARGQTASLAAFADALTKEERSTLQATAGRFEKYALEGKVPELRRLGYVAWIAAAGSAGDALLAAQASKERLADFLEAIPTITDDTLRGKLYDHVRPLISELPPNLEPERGGASLHQQGIQVDYFHPNPKNVAIETLAKLTPKASGIVPEIIKDVPQKKQNDGFALRFTGLVHVKKSGNYTFFTTSDDGSRLYVGDRLIVNNDGNHGMQERKGSIQLSAGAHPLVVTYYDQGGQDGLRVEWQGPGLKKQKIAADRLAVSGGETLHDVAIRALASIPGQEAKKFGDLAKLIQSGKHRAVAIEALLGIDESHWQAKALPTLANNLIGFLSDMPASSRTSNPASNATTLVKAVGAKLPKAQRDALEARLQNLDVRIIAIGTVPLRMIFDKERVAVGAGKPVEFRFTNTDEMPHNFAITLPGALEEIGELAEATAVEEDAEARQYIPASPKILLGSKLLQPGESQALSFEAPTEPGVYPYVCTYPGHWRRMYGALYVVENLEEYLADPEAYLAENPLPIKDELLKSSTRGREWKYDDLITSMSPIPHERSFEVGKELFKAATCVACHRLNDEGQDFGPKFTELKDEELTPEYLLRSMLEPSKVIKENFQSETFVLSTGRFVSGLVVEETGDTIKIVIDPATKGKPTEIKKSSVVSREKSPNSMMPEGLLNKLSREEIIDLVAYIHARGDKKSKIFGKHVHKH